MRRIQFLLIAAFATTAFVACSDDDDPKDKEPAINCELLVNKDHEKCEDFCDDDKNADAPACVVDVDPVADCIENFLVPSPKVDLCNSAEDAAAYAAVQTTIAGTAQTIALGCEAVGIDDTDEAAMGALDVCVACGIAAQTEVSAECSSCIGEVVACGVVHCISECAGGASDACDTCLEDNDCEDGLDECQGFPEADVDCSVVANVNFDDCPIEFCEDVDNADDANCEVTTVDCTADDITFDDCPIEFCDDVDNATDVNCEVATIDCSEIENIDHADCVSEFCAVAANYTEEKCITFCEDDDNDAHVACAD